MRFPIFFPASEYIKSLEVELPNKIFRLWNEMLNNNRKYSAIESDIDILCPISFTGTTAYFQPDILCYF